MLYTGPPESLRAVSVWPATTPLPSSEVPLGDGVPVLHDGRFRGAIAVRKGPGDALTGPEKRLVADLAAQAGLVLELRATAQRLVAAGDAARRRLERDLHDGAQQRLVALSLSLRLARSRMDADVGDAAELLDECVAELLGATSELRELARGIHPAILTDRGLAPALEALASRAPVPVEIDAVPDSRMPMPVEAVAYFVVAESLTNMAKYADAEYASVRVLRENGYAVVEIEDNGIGGADPSAGSGLRGLADRLAALDGRLEVDSPPGVGTTVRARIPCA
jgi:signal transduction histidine kinase